MATESVIELSVLDVSGRTITRLATGTYRPGRYRVVWSGGPVTGRAGAGIYFVRLRSGDSSVSRRLVMIR